MPSSNILKKTQTDTTLLFYGFEYLSLVYMRRKTIKISLNFPDCGQWLMSSVTALSSELTLSLIGFIYYLYVHVNYL